MFVANYVTAEPTTVSSSAGVTEARRLMAEGGIEHLPVVDDDGTLVGLVTERQTLCAPAGLRCREIMTSDPVTVRGDTSLIAALRLTCEHRLTALPVVSESGKLEGMITRGDLLDATYRLLGLDRAGGCIELGLIDRVDDAVTALATLRENGIEPLSAVVGCVRDDGDEPALYVRVPQRTVRLAERALSRAGLVLLVPENHEHTRSSTAVTARGTQVAPGTLPSGLARARHPQRNTKRSG